MLVIPAIDLRDGHCVRLQQGDYAAETVYFDDPVQMAKLWRVMNARVIHVVDLDAARTSGLEPNSATSNRAIIKRMAESIDIPIQVGGGVRTLEDIEELLSCGVYRVVLGTVAARDPDMVEEAVEQFGCRRIIVGIDARDGEVRVEGWEVGAGLSAVDLALDLENRGVRRFIYTDIARDGMLNGPNLEAYRELGMRLSHAHLTASGGVSGYIDLLRLAELSQHGVDSVIVGRALYENRFPCQQFWCWHQKAQVNLEQYSTAPLADDTTCANETLTDGEG
jgi:phosphoribosylformimino-5-aminoimidazole carboxamide ribotide isomerase